VFFAIIGFVRAWLITQIKKAVPLARNGSLSTKIPTKN
jgi:hypothetical protein